MTLSLSRRGMSRLSDSGKYSGPQPDVSQKTLPLCRQIMSTSSVQGQPGCAAMIFSSGNSAARSSIASGCDRRSRRPRPPRAPAGRAHVDEHGHAELVDLLEQRPQPGIVDREVAADRVEVKADEAQVLD